MSDPRRSRVTSREWHEQNREKSRENARRWREAHPGWATDYYRKAKRRAGGRAKLRARWAVQRALKRGVLVKPEACQQCGTRGRVQAHHQDYREPLLVTWICRACHALEHRKW